MKYYNVVCSVIGDNISTIGRDIYPCEKGEWAKREDVEKLQGQLDSVTEDLRLTEGQRDAAIEAMRVDVQTIELLQAQLDRAMEIIKDMDFTLTFYRGVDGRSQYDCIKKRIMEGE
jgi:hypothetical protein